MSGTALPVSRVNTAEPSYAVDPATGLALSVGQGSAQIATSQVSVGTGATLIVSARASRQAVTVIMDGAVDARIGTNAVTAITGVLLLGTKGSSMTIPTTAAIYGIAASTVAVSYLETF